MGILLAAVAVYSSSLWGILFVTAVFIMKSSLYDLLSDCVGRNDVAELILDCGDVILDGILKAAVEDGLECSPEPSSGALEERLASPAVSRVDSSFDVILDAAADFTVEIGFASSPGFTVAAYSFGTSRAPSPARAVDPLLDAAIELGLGAT